MPTDCLNRANINTFNYPKLQLLRKYKNIESATLKVT